jgi:hypothetical protein
MRNNPARAAGLSGFRRLAVLWHAEKLVKLWSGLSSCFENRPAFAILKPRSTLSGHAMIRTIQIGKYITAQGVEVRNLPNGLIVIRTGQKLLTGRPISKRAA